MHSNLLNNKNFCHALGLRECLVSISSKNVCLRDDAIISVLELFTDLCNDIKTKTIAFYNKAVMILILNSTITEISFR